MTIEGNVSGGSEVRGDSHQSVSGRTNEAMVVVSLQFLIVQYIVFKFNEFRNTSTFKRNVICLPISHIYGSE